jgi:hypothetical protein
MNVYFIIRLNKSIETLEDQSEWIEKFKKSINSTYSNLKIIDDKQIFEKDDEVGVVFSNIVNVIKQLNSKYND